MHANGPSSLDGKKISVTLVPNAPALTIYCEADECYINNNTDWESGTYSWDPVSATFGIGSLTARWGKVELVLDFSDGTLELYEGSSLPLAKQVDGTFILSDYPDGEIPFNRFFSGSFAELVADNHLQLPMIDGLQTSINDQGAFTVSGTAEDFYPETGANSLLSLSQDWVVQGELFRSTGKEVLISIEAERKAQFQLEVQAGLSNGGIFFNVEYERLDHEPFGDEWVGNYYSYSNLSVEMRIRNVAIENTFYVEWLNGTIWETLNALNWETGALTSSADYFSENALSTQLNRWEPMGDFVFNPQMEFKIVDTSDTNIAIDEIGFYSFSVTPSPPASLAGKQIEYQPSGGETSSVPWQELYGSDGYAQFGFSGSVIERIPYTYAQGVVTYTIFPEEIRLSFETATSGTYEYVEIDGTDLFVDEVGTFSIVVAPTLEVKTDDWQRSETMDSPLSTDYWNIARRTVDKVDYNAGELSFIFANGDLADNDYPEIEIEYGRTLPLDENWQVVLDDLYASPSVSNFRIGFDLSLLDSDTEVGCYFNYGDYGFGGRQVNADVERRGDTYVYRAGAFVRANQDARLQGGVNLRVRHNAASRDLLFEYQPDGASGWTELARLNLGDGTFAGTNQYGDGVAPISGEVLSASERFAMDVEVEAGQATQLGDLEIAGIEIGSYTPPPSIDTDGDGLADDVETDTGVYISANDTGTNPYIPDTDGDGLNDGDEVNIHGSSPIDSDSDDDTILDGIEVRHATFGFDPAVDSSARLAEFIAAAEELPGVITDAQNEGLSLGGVSLTPDGGNSLSVAFVIEESEDLTSWTTVETISHSLDTSGTKKFVRVRKPE